VPDYTTHLKSWNRILIYGTYVHQNIRHIIKTENLFMPILCRAPEIKFISSSCLTKLIWLNFHGALNADTFTLNTSLN